MSGSSFKPTSRWQSVKPRELPDKIIPVFRLLESKITTIEVPDSCFEEFKELVQRACDKWPDASPTIKHFADVITSGMPMQDYFGNPHLAGKPKSNQSDK